MLHLRSIEMKNHDIWPTDEYPFTIPLIHTMEKIEFHSPVTLFVGENGTGKSSLLEGLAEAIGSIRVGDESMRRNLQNQPARQLAKFLKLSWQIKTRKGLFLRAEDFITYTRRLSEIRKEMEEGLAEVDHEYRGKSNFAKALAALPYKRSIHEIENRYQGDLEKKSHGESFLDFFRARFIPSGLYLLDEPETPLSPLKQIAFISLIKELVQQDAQFIIVTHSPIIMAYPEATIYFYSIYKGW